MAYHSSAPKLSSSSCTYVAAGNVRLLTTNWRCALISRVCRALGDHPVRLVIVAMSSIAGMYLLIEPYMGWASREAFCTGSFFLVLKLRSLSAPFVINTAMSSSALLRSLSFFFPRLRLRDSLYSKFQNGFPRLVEMIHKVFRDAVAEHMNSLRGLLD